MGLWEDIELCGPKGNHLDRVPSEFLRREGFVSKYAWAVPSREAIKRVREFIGRGRVLEVGSGKGLWAMLLHEEGVDITATDAMSRAKSERFDPSAGRFFEVLNMDAEEAIRTFPEHEVLLMVWPPYSDPMAEKALEKFSGNKLVFVGEDRGGCTATDGFFEDLHDQWNESGGLRLPQWAGIHDIMTLWTKKPVEMANRNKAARHVARSALKMISQMASSIKVEITWLWQLDQENVRKLSELPGMRTHWKRYNEASAILEIDRRPDLPRCTKCSVGNDLQP